MKFLKSAAKKMSNVALRTFFDRFPNFPTTCGNLKGGYVYGEYDKYQN